MLTATTTVFHIGSRRHEEIRDLLGDLDLSGAAFTGAILSGLNFGGADLRSVRGLGDGVISP